MVHKRHSLDLYICWMLSPQYQGSKSIMTKPWPSGLVRVNVRRILCSPKNQYRNKVYTLWEYGSQGLKINSFRPVFRRKYIKFKAFSNSWSARRLTLLGKITITKSLAVSQIVYVLSSLPTPQGILQELNSSLYDFLWDGKRDKIKRSEMINDYDKGGLKMVDIQSFNTSLKIKWV